MNVWLIAFLTCVGLFQLVAIPGLILKRNDFADVLWGPAFPISVWVAAHFTVGVGSLDVRAFVTLILLSIWAVRLFAHVGVRNLSHSHEDVRYANWRRQWKRPVLRSWVQVFLLQPLILYVILTPVLFVLAVPSTNVGLVGYLGFFIWLGGFLCEAIADEQLRRFKAKPENKGLLMTTGLWSWSRHPNYFGEVAQWWGIWLIAAELPGGWLTLVSPIAMTFLILKVSGVSMLEDLMRKRPGFADYERRTSRFFPMPPRRS